MCFAQIEDRRHVRALAEKMDRDDRLHVGRAVEQIGELAHVDVESVRVDVHEDGRGSEPGHAAGGGEKGVRRRHHHIAGADAEGHEQHELGVGPAGAADGVRHPAVFRDRLFKRLRARPEDQRLRIGDLLHGGEALRFERRVLAAEIEERDGHRGKMRGRAGREKAKR